MKYFSGAELCQYENWVETHLAPRLQETIHGIQHLRNGRFTERVSFLKRGLGLIGYLNRAKTAEKEINYYDLRNGNQSEQG